MKKLFSLLLIVCVFSSCQQKLTRPLKGNYPSDYTAISDKSSDEVWNNIIDFCSKNGIQIKVTDRKSGLMISEPHQIRTYTFESKEGVPEKISADVIVGCETIGPFKEDCMPPNFIQTNIIFKVTEEEKKTLLTITLSNIVAWYSNWSCLKDVKSTGFFEKQIIEKMK